MKGKQLLRKLKPYEGFFIWNSKYKFLPWLEENMHIWEAFEVHADAAVRNGKEKLGARVIAEIARYYSPLADNTGPWKYNHNYSPDLARTYVILHPKSAFLWIYHRKDWPLFLQTVADMEGYYIHPPLPPPKQA